MGCSELPFLKIGSAHCQRFQCGEKNVKAPPRSNPNPRDVEVATATRLSPVPRYLDSDIFQFNVVGVWSWTLKINFTNPAAEPYTETNEVEEIVDTSYETIKDKVNDASTSYGASVSSGGRWAVVSVEADASVGAQSSDTLTNVLMKQETSKISSKSTITWAVGANSHFKLYQLRLSVAGIQHDLATYATSQGPMETVILNVTAQFKPFLKYVRVVYTEDVVSQPENSIIAFRSGVSNDMNYGYNSPKRVFLVAEWTTQLAERVTSILAILQDTPNDDYDNIVEGAPTLHWPYRYFKMLRDPAAKKAINQVIVVRSEKSPPADWTPANEGFNDCTANINPRRDFSAYVDYLALCWTYE